MVALLACAAFAIDLGSALVTQAELQNSSDAGSLAGGRELALIYKDLGSAVDFESYSLTGADIARLQNKVASLTGMNRAGGKFVSILPADIMVGTWDSDGAITPSTRGAKAVALKTRRDSSVNGAIQTVLAGVIGVDTLSVGANSAAALSSLGGLGAGGLGIPVGLSEQWFATHSCEKTPEITLYPTGTSCAGWHTFAENPASALRLTTILKGLKSGSYTSAPSIANSTIYNFTGGTLASVFDDMQALFTAKKDASGGWDVMLPVYQSTGCGNPSGPTLIVGYARARITTVTSTPDKTISGIVKCGIIDAATGGVRGTAKSFGTLYGSPGIIQ